MSELPTNAKSEATNGDEKSEATNGDDKSAAPNGDAPTPESKIPAWLTAELFEEHLKKQMPNFKAISSFKALPAISAGENYATIMLRIEMKLELQDGKTKDVTLMMKVPHQLPMMKEMMKKHNIFDIEATMYREVVPELEEMYRKAGVEVRFGAKYYDIKTPEELGVITLEDLHPAGFKNANRLEGLDEEHVKCALRRLAQWHAATAVRIETKGQYDRKLLFGFFVEEQRALMKLMFDSMAGSFIKCMQSYKGHEEYEEKIKKLQPRIIDEMFDNAKPDPSEFNVLNHGDFWANNIMFQYDAFGKIKETYLVDYQLPKYGTPAQDLYYFLISSTKYEIKLAKFEYFIRYYYDILSENLQLLKYPKKIPTLRDIHIGLYRHGLAGYTSATGTMAIVLLDPTEKASMENFMNEGEAPNLHQLMFGNERYRKHIEVLLPWLNNRGAFDC